MTCIAAIVHKRKVYMSCDSATSTGWDVINGGEKKICRKQILYRGKKEEMLIGTAGYARIGQIITHLFDPPERKCNIQKYLIGDFTCAFREVLKNNGAMQKRDERESISYACLIGYKGKIYTWCGNYSIIQCVEGFEVEGSGAVARALLYGLKDNKKLSPKEKLKRTQEYAAYYGVGVRPPFYYYSV